TETETSSAATTPTARMTGASDLRISPPLVRADASTSGHRRKTRHRGLTAIRPPTILTFGAARMERQIDLLMFDLDGTLAATGRDHANSVNSSRGPLGLDPLDDGYVYSRVGYGTEHLLRQSLPNEYDGRFEGILDRFLKHYEEHLLDTTVLYPHVEEVLERF